MWVVVKSERPSSHSAPHECIWERSGRSPRAGILATNVGDPDGAFPGSCFQLGPALVLVAIWGVSQKIGTLSRSLSLSLPLLLLFLLYIPNKLNEREGEKRKIAPYSFADSLCHSCRVLLKNCFILKYLLVTQEPNVTWTSGRDADILQLLGSGRSFTQHEHRYRLPTQPSA